MPKEPHELTHRFLERVKPTKRDKKCSNNLQWKGNTFYGNGAPYVSNVNRQLKRISDPVKLVKRCKAFIEQYGFGETVGRSGGKPVESDRINISKRCRDVLYERGFTPEQIKTIFDNVHSNIINNGY